MNILTPPPIKPTKAIARKVLDLVSQGLVAGVGQPIPGQMCVEAAVCYAMGLPHGDDPQCVGRAVRAFKIKLNDCVWPSNMDRAEGMKGLAIAQLGSDTLDQMAFGKLMYLRGVQKILPFVWRDFTMNTELLLKVKVAILAEPESFDMTCYYSLNSDSPCGSTACIAGWAVAFDRKFASLKEGLDAGDIWWEAKEALGISFNQTHSLFFDSDWPSEFANRYRNCKTARGRAQVAADRIDRFIDTEGRI